VDSEYLERGFSQNKKGKVPIGFSRKGLKPKGTIFLFIVGLEALSEK
jgi:hypothetical protein